LKQKPFPWTALLDDVERGEVIPVLGTGAITVGPDNQPYYPGLVQRLASEQAVVLNLESGPVSLHTLAHAYIETYNDIAGLYDPVRRALRSDKSTFGRTLHQLAEIDHFRIFLTTTVDHLLADAIDAARWGRAKRTVVLGHHVKSDSDDLPDLDKNPNATCVYHLLGHPSGVKDFVLWEDDALNSIVTLSDRLKNLTRLSQSLSRSRLLLLGIDFPDWLLRFFLRVIKQVPLRELKATPHYFANLYPGDEGQKIVIFFDTLTGSLHFQQTDPVQFIAELSERWAKYARTDVKIMTDVPKLTTNDGLPYGHIFISYASEDRPAAQRIRDLLVVNGCYVWFDRDDLAFGMNWHDEMQTHITERSALFLSVISSNTEAITEGYLHKERRAAAERAESFGGQVTYYIPFVIDQTRPPFKREPKVFNRIQAGFATDGELSLEQITRLRDLQLRRQAEMTLRPPKE
jgi:hypothetical protein